MLRLSRAACAQLRYSAEEASAALGTTDCVRLRLDLLREALATCEGIRPAYCFVMSRESLLASAGLLVTYFVVIFQFNITEHLEAIKSNHTVF
jgi:hypothetical protein